MILTSPKHYASWNGPWAETEEINGLRYFRTPRVRSTTFPLGTEVRIMAATTRAMRALTKREQPDLLHAHSPMLNAIPALWVARAARIPFVYEMRSLWEDAAVNHGTYGPRSWRYRLVRAFEAWACRQADHVTVLCQGLRDDLIARGVPGAKITVVPNGVDLDKFSVCESDPSLAKKWNLEGKQVIGFLGSFSRYEGLDLLVEAVARLSTTRPHIVLLLVGGGKADAELRATVARLGLERRVIMPGPISQDRIPSVYALVDILAYPRLSTRLTEVVTPLKPLEAMAMGKALVASDIGGHRELIRHGYTGLLFKAADVHALEAALVRLLDDQAIRHTLGRQGAAWVRQERSWDKTTAPYVKAYTTVLKRYLGDKDEPSGRHML